MTLSADGKDLKVFLEFVKAESQYPPGRREAAAVWEELLHTLGHLSGDVVGQRRFLELLAGEKKPTSTDRPGAALAFPADHACNLYRKLEGLDRPWLKRAGTKLLGIGGSAGAGALLKWVLENWDKFGGIFFLAVLVGFLAMDDIYDGGTIWSFALVGALIGILLQQVRRRPPPAEEARTTKSAQWF